MEETGRKIYKTIMLIVITAAITAVSTTMFVYQKLTGTMGVNNIVNSGNNTGLELTLAQIRSMLEEEYMGELDDEAMIESAIKGYVAGVGDIYTEYYPPVEMTSVLDTTYGNYIGIGIYMIVDSKNGVIEVQRPMEGSPAEAAGIKAGDIINKVNGEEVNAENVSEISDKIKGEEGTTVNLEILRGKETLNVAVERKRIVVKHIKSKVIEDNIGYIQLKDFEGGVAKEFKETYDALKSEGITSLIIDIRDNGGGIVDEAIEILDFFCKKDSTLLITVDKKGNEDITKAKEDQQIDVPVVILVNGSSASASEILAGALKDNGIAKLVGTKTYGKGVIQTLHRLTDGSGLKITSEEYYTPNHNRINKTGIEPDYEVKSNTINVEEPENDAQLQKAIELLK